MNFAITLLLICLLRIQTSSAFSGVSTTAATRSALPVDDDEKTPRCDVVVVGAGPAGLVLAHALIDRGHSVRVLERRPSFRPVGSAVFMHPFALLSLRSISPDVEANLVRASTQVGSMAMRSIVNEDNVMVADKFDDAPEKLGAPFVVVKFWDMLRALKKGLPDEIFQFGHDVQGFETMEDGGVRLHFINGETSGSCEAGMVIDAGGIRSNIRRQLVSSSPSIPRCRAYMAIVPSEKAKEIVNDDDGRCSMASRELCFYQGDGVAMTMARFHNGDVWWTYTNVNDGLDDPSLELEDLVERMDIFPLFIRDLVEVTDDVLETTIAELPVTLKWGKGSVTLLGDAAHAQLPALGLGCSTAFADIEELCRQIDTFGLSEKALRWYELVRIPQTAVLQIFSRWSYFASQIVGKQK